MSLIALSGTGISLSRSISDSIQTGIQSLSDITEAIKDGAVELGVDWARLRVVDCGARSEVDPLRVGETLCLEKNMAGTSPPLSPCPPENTHRCDAMLSTVIIAG